MFEEGFDAFAEVELGVFVCPGWGSHVGVESKRENRGRVDFEGCEEGGIMNLGLGILA